MSLRYALLGLLGERAMSGYDLTKRFQGSLNFVWTASHSQIYTELGRLTRDGLIEVVAEGPRGRKEYALTPAGRAEHRRWMLEEPYDWTTRSEPLLRTFFLWLLEPGEARELLQRQLEHHRKQLRVYEEFERTLDPEIPSIRAGRVVLEAGIRFERARIEWAEWAIEEYGGRVDD